MKTGNSKTTSEEGLILKESDYLKLSALAAGTKLQTLETEVTIRQLEEELGRAALVSPEALPPDVVAMNSTVKYEDLESKKQATVTLVYPHDANLSENKVSVLAPVGAALIGLRVGQEIRWAFPGGREKRLKVLQVS